MTNITDFDWTDERVAALKRLWTRGQSASQIAHEICDHESLSRSAVIGKAHRLGLKRRDTQSNIMALKAPKAPSPPKAPKPHKETSMRLTPGQCRGVQKKIEARKQDDDDGGMEMAPIPTTPADDLNIPVEQRKTLLQLTADSCRWPVGDPRSSAFFFCGGPATGTYCTQHARRA